MAHIEIATNNHIDGIIELAKIGHTEFIHANNVNEHVLNENLKLFINSPDFIVLVVLDNGIVVGAFCGQVARVWWSNDWVAQDIGVFIKKENRGKMLAFDMFKQFIDWASGFDRVKNIRFTSSSGVDLTNFFKRLGADKIGVVCNINIGV